MQVDHDDKSYTGADTAGLAVVALVLAFGVLLLGSIVFGGSQ